VTLCSLVDAYQLCGSNYCPSYSALLNGEACMYILYIHMYIYVLCLPKDSLSHSTDGGFYSHSCKDLKLYTTVKNFPAIYRTLSLISALTRTTTGSFLYRIQPKHVTNTIVLLSKLPVGFTLGVFTSGFPTKIFSPFLICANV
jgi:hypothetical protein